MKEKGITLIALVITIIILLILAGVSIATLTGENGILTKAQNAAKTYDIASEREYIQQNVLSVQLGEYMKNVSSKKLGETLNKRNLENASNWHIIKVNDKSYDTGWNYIEKGTELQNYRTSQNSWLVNYETGEIIQLEEANYISLSAGDILAVKDNLIISVDSSLVDENIVNSEEALEKQLGENVDLVDFNYNENSGLTSDSFNFDGVDDYIKILYNDQKKKEEFIKQGFTFEFYGDATQGSTYKYDNGKKTVYDGPLLPGGFCWCNGDDNNYAKFQFNFSRTNNNLVNFAWCSGGKQYKKIPIGTTINSNTTKYFSVGPESGGPGFEGLGWHTYATIPSGVDNSKPFYVSLTFSPIIVGKYDGHDICEQKLYSNGKLVDIGYYYYDDWKDLEGCLDELQYFYICKSSRNLPGVWGHCKMDCYALRLYSGVLSEEDINKNYEKSIEYHSLLEK